jgi:hypothetical protein
MGTAFVALAVLITFLLLSTAWHAFTGNSISI